MGTRAGIYARISDDRLGDQAGVKRQLADCRALCERKGWPVLTEYIDNDVSAYAKRVRKDYRRLLADIRDGAIDSVVVWHLDRLHRQPKELEEFFETCDAAGLKDLASVTGDVDLSTDDGRFMARILGAVARKSSDDQSRRIRRKALELAQAGKPSGGGSRPYGYANNRLDIVPEEAGVIRQAAERFLAGESIRSICTELNSRGLTGTSGKPWVQETLRKILMSPRISGQREHKGEVVAKAQWPAIISVEMGERIRGILKDPARRNYRTPRKYLLTQLMRCGLCGARLRPRPRGVDSQRRYICLKAPGAPGCGRTAVLCEHLDPFIVAAVFHRLDSPEAEAIVSHADPDDIGAAQAQADLSLARAHLEELATAYGNQAITLPEFLAARKPIETRIDAATRRLGEVNRSSVLASYVGNVEALKRQWDELPLARQRAIVGALIDHIELHPAVKGRRTFDPARVRVSWRH